MHSCCLHSNIFIPIFSHQHLNSYTYINCPDERPRPRQNPTSTEVPPANSQSSFLVKSLSRFTMKTIFMLPLLSVFILSTQAVKLDLKASSITSEPDPSNGIEAAPKTHSSKFESTDLTTKTKNSFNPSDEGVDASSSLDPEELDPLSKPTNHLSVRHPHLDPRADELQKYKDQLPQVERSWAEAHTALKAAQQEYVNTPATNTVKRQLAEKAWDAAETRFKYWDKELKRLGTIIQLLTPP